MMFLCSMLMPYDSPLAVIMPHTNTNPNPSPNLSCAVTIKNQGMVTFHKDPDFFKLADSSHGQYHCSI